MTDWQSAFFAAFFTLLGVFITKILDFAMLAYTKKREFNQFIHQNIYNEIESLKSEIGKLYELASNWKAFDQKQQSYLVSFENDHELVGKYNKFPSIVKPARDTLHWCKLHHAK